MLFRYTIGEPLPWACTRPAWKRWTSRPGHLTRTMTYTTLSSHNCAHVSTGSFFSRYIWKIVVMLHGLLVSLPISFSGCTIMVSFPHPMPFEGVYIMFVHNGSVVSYLPLMAQRYAHGQHQCLLTWWSECEQKRKERKRIIPAAQPMSFPSLTSFSRRWKLVVTQNPLFLFS